MHILSFDVEGWYHCLDPEPVNGDRYEERIVRAVENPPPPRGAGNVNENQISIRKVEASLVQFGDFGGEFVDALGGVGDD